MNRRITIALAGILALVLVAVVVVVSAQEGGAEEPSVDVSIESLEFDSHLADELGVLITNVDAEGPAAAAGLRRGDIILEIDDQAVNTPDDVRELIRETEPGETVTLSVLRCEEPDELQVTLGELEASGKGYLGVEMYPSMHRSFASSGLMTKTFEIEKEFVLGVGALVVGVEENTPASAAGLQEGDRIVAVDGEEVTPERQLSEIVRSKSIGDRVELRIERGAEELTLEATLAEHPEEAGIAYLGVRGVPTPHGPNLDMMPGRPFDFDSLPHLEGGEGLSGAIVFEVSQGGPAEQAGIKEGDLITAVGGEPVDHPGSLVELIHARQPGDEVELTILRDDEELTLTATLGSQETNSGEAAYLGVTARGFMRMEDMPFRAPFGSEEGEFEFHFPPFDWDEMPRHDFDFHSPDLNPVTADGSQA